jgi:hypothetical protein
MVEEGTKEEGFGMIKGLFNLVYSKVKGIVMMIYNLVRKVVNKKFIDMLFRLLKQIWTTIQTIINQILTKHFADKSYGEIFTSLFSISEYKAIIERSRVEAKNVEAHGKSQELTFPLPKLQEEPDSISDPSYITLFIRALLSMITIMVIIIIGMIIMNISYTIFNINVKYQGLQKLGI